MKSYLCTFRREVSCEKLGITSGQRQLFLELFQKMAYASSEKDYEDLYTELQKSAPREVKQYYDNNWHCIKNEWVLHFKAMSGSFLNSTNNRLESLNGKLKQVISRHSSLEQFIEHFFVTLTALRTERDHKAAILFQKVRVHQFGEGTPEMQYTQLLTSYASAYVTKQLSLVHKVKDITDNGDSTYSVPTSGGVVNVSLVDCDCLFRKSMSLPCRHIFALRKQLDQPLYDQSLCITRWTSEYYQKTQRIFLDTSCTASFNVSKVASKPTRALSQHQKYRKAVALTSELASIASEASGNHFARRLKLINKLIHHWKCGDEVAIKEIGNDKILIFNLLLHVCIHNIESDDSSSENDCSSDNEVEVFNESIPDESIHVP